MSAGQPVPAFAPGGRPPRVLLVDDDPHDLRSLEAALTPLAVELSTATSAIEALRQMKRMPPDLVVVDGNLQGVSGLDLLRRMRHSEVLAAVPVVLQAESASSRETCEALDAGAAYCVSKTNNAQLLSGVVRAALRASLHGRQHLRAVVPSSTAITRLREGTFEFRTLPEAQELALELSQLCPNAERTAMGLIELMNNAVEHGNLEISYQEKTRLCRDGTWTEEIERRAQLPQYRERVGTVRVQRSSSSLTFQVTDEGPGFAWGPFLSFDPERAEDPNGRGIALARRIAFSSLSYEGRGNVVNAEVTMEGSE